MGQARRRGSYEERKNAAFLKRIEEQKKELVRKRAESSLTLDKNTKEAMSDGFFEYRNYARKTK
jgi:hypothetical protein